MSSEYWNGFFVGAVIGALIVFVSGALGAWAAIQKRKPITKEMEELTKRGDEIITTGDRLLKSGCQNKEQWEAWSDERRIWQQEAKEFETKRLRKP